MDTTPIYHHGGYFRYCTIVTLSQSTQLITQVMQSQARNLSSLSSESCSRLKVPKRIILDGRLTHSPLD